jgi:hypothetical protein
MTPTKTSLPWDIREVAIETKGIIIPKRKALYRNDTNELLTIVSTDYKVFSNKMLEQVCNEITSKHPFTLAGMEEFEGGKKVMAWLKYNSTGLVINGQAMQEYLLIGNYNTGSGKFFIGTTGYMIRCTNQFTKKIRTFAWAHRGDITEVMESIPEIIQTYENGRKDLYSEMEKMAEVKIDNHLVEELINHLYPKVKDEVGRMEDLRGPKYFLEQAIARETDELGDTLWGVFNGVTWFTSHDVRKQNNNFGNVAGTAERINRIAWEFLQERITWG